MKCWNSSNLIYSDLKELRSKILVQYSPKSSDNLNTVQATKRCGAVDILIDVRSFTSEDLKKEECKTL